MLQRHRRIRPRRAEQGIAESNNAINAITPRTKKAQDHFSTEAERRCSHYYGLASMTTKKKSKKAAAVDQDRIDQLVVSQADNNSAWSPPIRVKRSKPASLSIPGELAARAAFLARLHREGGVDKRIERVVRERVELEERAFTEAKRELAS